MNDVTAPKQKNCEIEVKLFPYINKHLLRFCIFKVVKLDWQWKSYILKQLSMPKYDTNDEDNDNIEANEKYEA